jgi:hypothetical protein
MEMLDRHGRAHDAPAHASKILVGLYSIVFDQTNSRMPAAGQGGHAVGVRTVGVNVAATQE